MGQKAEFSSEDSTGYIFKNIYTLIQYKGHKSNFKKIISKKFKK